MSDPTKKHEGSCHCGAVRFSVAIDATKGSRCNCSICTKTSTLGGIVKPDAFTLKTSEDALGAYVWGGRTGKRLFCKTCGVTCFLRGHLPELGGDYVSVNLLCLDDIDPIDVAVVYWDGRHDNWKAGPRDRPWPIAVAPAAA